MAFTPEQKKAYRAKRKRETEKAEASMGDRMIKQRPPDSKLKAPYKNQDLGKSTVDYGGHQKALNFPLFPPDIQQLDFVHDGDTIPETESEDELPRPTKIGTLTIGLAYEGDWKANSRLAGNGKRKMCKMSEQHLDFLTTIKKMLHPLVHSTLALLMEETMRVNVLRGAQTLAHTDAYKGNAPNFMYIPKEKHVKNPGYLCYDVFPKFKHSVVKIDGKLYVPHSFSEASKECRCIGANPKDPTKPIYYVFPDTIIDRMEPYGDLTFGIVGWKVSGELQIIDKWEDACLYQKPLNFIEYTWDQVIKLAGQSPVAKKPHRRVYRCDKLNEWMKFEATMYRHWFVGDPMTLRIHVFFRTIREATPSSNVIRKGKRINYIDAKEHNNWKIYEKGMWTPLNTLNK